MDASRFDAVSRAAAAPRNRRGVVRALVASVLGLGGVVASHDAGREVAAKTKKKKKCAAPLTRCGKKCVDLQTDGRHCGGCNVACFVDIDCVEATCQCRDLNAECVTDGQCCSGKCSTEVISTCRKLDCVETGACGNDADCCGGFCVAGCCQGIC